MTEAKPRVPALEGLFKLGPEPDLDACLIGSQCADCGSYFFPRERVQCRNPRCRSVTLIECELSTEGTLWSYTSSEYKPPAPFIAAEPFTPFAIAAVELELEKLVVLGQVIAGVAAADLKIGMTMRLVSAVLDEDEKYARMVWKWAPKAASAAPSAPRSSGLGASGSGASGAGAPNLGGQ